MTDRYERIREALKMRPTPGPWELKDGRTDTIENAQGYPVCSVHHHPYERYGHGVRAAYIAACDPDTIRELLVERDALAADNERLKAENERLRQTLQAEPAPSARSGAVRVKQLEWVETHSRRSDEDPTTEWDGGFKADSALGYYEISMGFGSDAYYWAVTNPLGDDVGSDFEDPSYAKAAAQADYERRILSALEARYERA